MPTIKEKIEISSSSPPEYDDGQGRMSKGYCDWFTARHELLKTVEGKAYVSAMADENDVKTDLNKARQERDKLQKTVDALEAKLKVAEHVVAILGSVEVP